MAPCEVLSFIRAMFLCEGWARERRSAFNVSLFSHSLSLTRLEPKSRLRDRPAVPEDPLEPFFQLVFFKLLSCHVNALQDLDTHGVSPQLVPAEDDWSDDATWAERRGRLSLEGFCVRWGRLQSALPLGSSLDSGYNMPLLGSESSYEAQRRPQKESREPIHRDLSAEPLWPREPVTGDTRWRKAPALRRMPRRSFQEFSTLIRMYHLYIVLRSYL